MPTGAPVLLLGYAVNTQSSSKKERTQSRPIRTFIVLETLEGLCGVFWPQAMKRKLKKAILGRLPHRWESGVSFNQAANHAVVEGLHFGQGVPVQYCDRVETVVNNTCFFECNELLLSDAVLFRAQPLGGLANTGEALPVLM
jgi:hypothetical protein